MSDEGQGTDIVAREQKESLPTTEIIRRGASLPEERWTREKIAAALKLLPEGFQTPQYGIAYMARCERAGLDPLMGELHAWYDPKRKKIVFHTDIDGWVNIVKNDPDIEGVSAAVVCEEDDFKWHRNADGTITVEHSGGIGGKPIGAYCAVHMKGAEPDHIEVRRMEDYRHLSGKDNWKNHPKDMILIRCYEAAVGKKSTKAAGIYAEESFHMGDDGRVMGGVAREATGQATDEREDELTGKLASSEPRDVTPPPPPEEGSSPSSTGEQQTESPDEPESDPPEETTSSPQEQPSKESDTGDGEDEEKAAAGPERLVKHTEGLPEGYAIVEAVYADHSSFYPCTLDEEGKPDEKLTEQRCEDYDQAKRIIRGTIDRPEPEDEEEEPADEGAVESGGIDDTPRQPCPICGEMLQPKQMGGHKSGHSKKDEALPSDKYRIRKASEGEYQVLKEGVVVDEDVPNYLQALALADRHHERTEEDRPEPEFEEEGQPEDVQEPEEPEKGEQQKWQEQFERLHNTMSRYDLEEVKLRDVVREAAPHALTDDRVRLAAMTSSELERAADLLEERNG